MRKYTKEHEWVELEGDMITVGITDHAQEELGDIVFVELPEEGAEIEKDEGLAVIESVKAVANVYAPAGGTISEINENLEDEPQSVNGAPYEAWIAKLQINDASFFDDLMEEEAYLAFVEAEG